MAFVWDSANDWKVLKHRVTESQVEQAFNPLAMTASAYNDEKEVRHAIVGPTLEGKLIFVVYTFRGDDIRVVTAYPASRKHRREYEKFLNGEIMPRRNPQYVHLEFPSFESDEQEAEWWDTHKEKADELFERAFETGTVRRFVVQKKQQNPVATVSIQLGQDTLKDVKRVARRLQVPYQEYLVLLIQHGLSNDGAGGKRAQRSRGRQRR